MLDRRAPAPLVRSEAQPGLRWNSNAGTTEGLGGACPSKQVLSNFILDHKLNKSLVMTVDNLAAMIPNPNYWFDCLLLGSMWALLLLGPLWDRKPIRGKPVDIKIQFY